jgi:hypothetical protein
MQPMGELIPDGTFAKLCMIIKPGGVNGFVQCDAGLLKESNSSDAKMLDCEFAVLEGPYAGRKLWQSFTVAGGKLDNHGNSKGWNISKATFRAMIESALGINPKDTSQQAAQKRQMEGLKKLDGIVFAARIMIEPANDPQYSDKNKIANVVIPTDPEYAAIMNGQDVEPKPVNAKPRGGGGNQQQAQPAWGGNNVQQQMQQPAQQTPQWQQQGGGNPHQQTQMPAWANG